MNVEEFGFPEGGMQSARVRGNPEYNLEGDEYLTQNYLNGVLLKNKSV